MTIVQQQNLTRRPGNQLGQIMVMAMFMIIPFVLLVAMVFNTGEHIKRRIETQNSADSAAITQATWSARAMNVMAMNNVAISQSFVVNVVGTAAIGPTAENTVLLGREAIDIGKDLKRLINIIKSCSATPCPACIPCWIYASDRSYCLYRRSNHYRGMVRQQQNIAHDLGISWRNPMPPGAKTREFGEIAVALSAMNKRISKDFPDITQNLQKELAEYNLLTDAPRFYTAYKGGQITTKGKRDYTQTGLPVKPISLKSGSQLELLGLTPLKTSAEKGSRKTGLSWGKPKKGPLWNFQEHGYKLNKGPYLLAKNRSIKVIDKLQRDLGKRSLGWTCSGPNKRARVKQKKVLNPLWETQARLQFTIVPSKLIEVYELDKDFFDRAFDSTGLGWMFSEPDELSLIAFTRTSQDGGVLANSQFENHPGAVYGIAQAEIFNDTHADLYTQNWRARLQQTTLLTGEHRKEAVKATKDFKKLHEFLNKFSAKQHEALSTQ